MDNKIRVHELAKQLKSTSKRIIEMLSEIGIFNKSYMSTLEDEELQAFYNHIGYHPDAGKKQETIGASAIGAGSSEKQPLREALARSMEPGRNPAES